jgi:hypothetical protein
MAGAGRQGCRIEHPALGPLKCQASYRVGTERPGNEKMGHASNWPCPSVVASSPLSVAWKSCQSEQLHVRFAGNPARAPPPPAMTHRHSDQTVVFIQQPPVGRSRTLPFAITVLDHDARPLAHVRRIHTTGAQHWFAASVTWLPQTAASAKRTAARSLLTLPESHSCLDTLLPRPSETPLPTGPHSPRAMRLVRQPPTRLPAVVSSPRSTPTTAALT